MTALCFENVSKTFRSRHREVLAVNNVTISCPREKITAVLGTSGCGKTTMLRLVAGLERPCSGQILVENRPITGPTPEITMVSQESSLLPWRRAGSNIELGLEIIGIPKQERRKQAEDLISRLHLSPETAKSFPSELSGGQRQRISLARAIATNPKILLFDEPFTAIDEFTRHKLRDIVIELWDQNKMTILMVTHSIEDAVFMADEIVVMDDGNIIGTIKNDIARPRDLYSEEFLRMQRKTRDLLAISQKSNTTEKDC